MLASGLCTTKCIAVVVVVQKPFGWLASHLTLLSQEMERGSCLVGGLGLGACPAKEIPC